MNNVNIIIDKFINDFNLYANNMHLDFDVECCLPIDFDETNNILTLKLILAVVLNKYDYPHLDYSMSLLVDTYKNTMKNDNNLIDVTYLITDKTNNKYYMYMPVLIKYKII